MQLYIPISDIYMWANGSSFNLFWRVGESAATAFLKPNEHQN